MKTVTNKELLKFIFNQMEKLDSGTIDVDEAKSQANLAKQANNSLKYELDRANLHMKLEIHNKKSDSDISIRDIES